VLVVEVISVAVEVVSVAVAADCLVSFAVAVAVDCLVSLAVVAVAVSLASFAVVRIKVEVMKSLTLKFSTHNQIVVAVTQVRISIKPSAMTMETRECKAMSLVR